jgi:ATP-dependent protease ClpP protease subunit
MSTKEEEVEVQEEYVKTIGNEILFYADVDRENTLDFVDKFKKLEIELLKKKAELVGYEPSIRVHIMSEGGCIFAGMNMMNVLETSRVKVITIAQGSCCSAATFMLLGGSERRMGKNAYILIHQISTEMWGNFQELKHELKSTDKFMKKLKQMYLQKTKIPEKMLKKLMKKDIYLSPEKCLKYKIVDALE